MFSVEVMDVMGVVEDVVPKISVIAAVRSEPIVILSGVDTEGRVRSLCSLEQNAPESWWEGQKQNSGWRRCTPK